MQEAKLFRNAKISRPYQADPVQVEKTGCKDGKAIKSANMEKYAREITKNRVKTALIPENMPTAMLDSSNRSEQQFVERHRLKYCRFHDAERRSAMTDELTYSAPSRSSDQMRPSQCS